MQKNCSSDYMDRAYDYDYNRKIRYKFGPLVIQVEKKLHNFGHSYTACLKLLKESIERTFTKSR